MPNSTAINTLGIRTAIYNQLITEMSSRLAGVQAVGYSWLNQVNLYPYVSIYSGGKDIKKEATRRKRNTIHFVVGVAYKSEVSLEDAYTQIMRLVEGTSDGNGNWDGNGVQAILEDPNFYTWNQQASWSEITQIRYYDNVKQDTQSTQNSYVAYAVIQYDVVQFVDITLNPS